MGCGGSSCGRRCVWGGKKGLAGFTKGMALVTKGRMARISRAGRVCRIVVGVHDFAALVACGCARSLVVLQRQILLLDEDQRSTHGVIPPGQPIGIGSTRTLSAAPGPPNFVGSRHGRMKRRQFAHHAFIFLLLVGMHCLSMLTEVVQTRKLLRTMARKGPFACMFPAGYNDDQNPWSL